MIILSGASSVGKSTLAKDWCEKHKEYHHIEEVARDIMKEKSITRSDLMSYMNDGRKFFEFQYSIFEEQNRREHKLVEENCSFIADRGPDPLAFVCMHMGQITALELAELPASKSCLQRYRANNCRLIIVCPLDVIEDDSVRMVPTNKEQLQYTNYLRTLLDELNIPYKYCDRTDHLERLKWLEGIV